MRNDLSDITIVMDRSGSMQSTRGEAESGLNAFIKEQKAAAGDALMTVVQFDTQYEVMHNGLPVQEMPYVQLIPRGMTALLDAVGKAINTAGDRLSAMAEKDRPGLVVFVIVTDGGENSSQEFKPWQIKEMVERQQKDYSWKFVFLGANIDAFAAAQDLGVPLAYASPHKANLVHRAYQATASNVSNARRGMACGELSAAGAVDLSYTPAQREDMNQE